jgi:hypothetical protein
MDTVNRHDFARGWRSDLRKMPDVGELAFDTA